MHTFVGVLDNPQAEAISLKARDLSSCLKVSFQRYSWLWVHFREYSFLFKVKAGLKSTFFDSFYTDRLYRINQPLGEERLVVLTELLER